MTKIDMADLRRRMTGGERISPATHPHDPAPRDYPAQDPRQPSPRDYAPPAVRAGDSDKVIIAVRSFGSLPTKEIDDVMSATRQEFARLEHAAAEAQREYELRIGDLVRDFNRLRENVRLSMETIKALRDQHSQLNARDVTPEEIERDE